MSSFLFINFQFNQETNERNFLFKVEFEKNNQNNFQIQQTNKSVVQLMSLKVLLRNF